MSSANEPEIGDYVWYEDEEWEVVDIRGDIYDLENADGEEAEATIDEIEL